jgi:hypothetical protein
VGGGRYGLLNGDKASAHRRGQSVPLYPLATVAILAFGLFWRAGALQVGFVADDLAQLAMLDASYPLPRAAIKRSAFDLFDFSDGSENEARPLFETGFYPWYAHRGLRLSMFRPLASASIWLDHRLFGSDPWPYHVHSALVWLAMLGTIALLFRQLLPPGPALLALLFFALDEAHGVLIAWIANRAAMVSTAAAVLALYFYVRWRRGGSLQSRWLAIGLYALALGFGEYALCALGYFAAYELYRYSETVRTRLRALAPLLLLSLVFLVVRGALGDTPRHSGVYIDPVTEPLSFAIALPIRLPVLLSDVMLGVRGEYWTFGPPWTVAWFEKAWVSRAWLETLEPWRAVHLALGIASLCLYGLICWAVLRAPERRELRFLALGSVLALVPVVGSFPSSRLVLLALIGFAPVLAVLTFDGLSRARRLLREHPVRAVIAATPGLLAATYHVIVPAQLTRSEITAAVTIGDRIREAALTLDLDEAELPRQDVVVLAAVEGGTSMYVPLTRLRLGRSAPHSYSTLSMTAAPYRLARIADKTLTLRFEGRYAMLSTAAEQLLRSPREPLHVGDRVVAGIFTVTVLSLYDGRPQSLRLDFDRSLDDPSLVFVLPTHDGIRRFYLPPVGDSIMVPMPAVPGM